MPKLVRTVSYDRRKSMPVARRARFERPTRSIRSYPQSNLFRIERIVRTNLALRTDGWCNGTTFTTVGANLGFNFKLDGLNIGIGTNSTVATNSTAMPGLTELQSLFSEYRIDRVVVELRSTVNSQSVLGATATSNGIPSIISCLDLNDDVPSILTDMQQFSRAKMHTLSDSAGPAVIVLKPRPQLQLFGSSTGYGYMDTAPWLNTDSATIAHYGLKIGMDPGQYTGTATNIGVIQVTVKYSLSFKNTR